MTFIEINNMMKRRFREFILVIVNHILCGTRFYGIKRLLLNCCCGVSIGKGTRVVSINISNCSVVTIGRDCWIGKNFTIYGDGKVSIDDNCDIAPDVSFCTGSHEIGKYNRRAGKGKLLQINVGKGCWIGARAMLLGDICLGNGNVIGACCLVNKSFGENHVLVGVPARAIKNIK